MTQDQFETACGKTLVLVMLAAAPAEPGNPALAWREKGHLGRRGLGPTGVAAERQPDSPNAPSHLAWMLMQAALFYAEDKREKANRWLGFVQGVLSCLEAATLDELKKANMPEGETFNPERI